MAVVGCVGAGMGVVDDMDAGQSKEGWSRKLERSQHILSVRCRH